MKKIVILIVACIILGVLLMPKKIEVDDGGSTIYSSLCPCIYEVYDYHSIRGTWEDNTFLVGRTVEIFGKEVYNDTKIVKYE
ncbi:MAG: hypothetical protein IKY12_06225 [Clostridia bacterium]|nr:hypothetical protein [Clostridia bacterium]